MKKFALFLTATAFTITTIPLYAHPYEWITLTPENSLQTFSSIKPVFVAAFEKVRAAQLHEEHDESYTEEQIAQIQKNEFDDLAIGITEQVTSRRDITVYAALVKNAKQEPIGFALFEQAPINTILLLMQTFGFIKSDAYLPADLLNQRRIASDEAYVLLLAVDPHHQKTGLGKLLGFSIFEQCPKIKKLYMTTSATATNKRLRKAYEQAGFENIGYFKNENYSEKIFYCYQKPNQKVAIATPIF